MTIKKPAGGAAIADRFKLDTPDPKANSAVGKATTAAVIAGTVALIIAGILTFVLYQHWEFLRGA